MDVAVQAALILFISVGVLLVIGVPISVSVGLASVLAMFTIVDAGNGMLTSAQRLFTGINSFTLIAIPFFILAGVIMNNGGIAIRLVNCAKVLSGRMPGSLAHTNILANMLFGSISGSAVAASAAVGSTMTPLQEKEGYDRKFSAAVNIASAPTGMLIPPSNTLIVYSLVSGGTSIAALFMAGYLPGILWGLGCMIVALVLAKRYRLKRNDRISFSQALLVMLDAIPSLLLVVIVIGGIIGGVFTATEGSAIAVVYSLLLSFIYRTIKVKDLPRILLEATKTTSIVIFLVGVSSIMSWVMSFTNILGLIADGLLSLTSNIFVILLIMNVVLLLVGTFMDPTPAVLIFTPIFLPIAVSFGIDPVHFGIMLVFNLCIGTITPPVGPVLFVGAKVANLKIEDVIKPLLPFFVVSVAVLLLITYVPQLSIWLPGILGLHNG
ncbi:TRAP transporter large permease [Alkalihalobacillus oceani]|uniref:TRAP transporter large permease n=1 Tax=Halalkalibacter oceani TaxID=1653776 RepID=UPI00203AD938|nr:TRAP transporter large permease [Halalkalibacter oceani]MCM3761308.1 TRAP transporter large permease [Halalkalibacter oceani]